MLTAIWNILLSLAPWLLLGTVVAGLLHGLLPANLIRQHLRGRGGVVKAVMIGVPMPLCSCGVIPAGIGLREDGASRGSAIGFLISTPQTGVDSILVSASFLGWPFALFKVGSAALTGLIGGWLTDRVVPEETNEPSTSLETESKASRSVSAMVEHGLFLLRSIWRWLVVGILVSAAIDVFVPDQALAGVGAYGIVVAALATLVIALPLYVCATASVPIAAALVASGFPTGAALVFLMAGPATNVATMGAVYRSFGKRTLAVYLSTVIVGSVGLGVAFDWLLGSAAVSGVASAAHEHASWWEVLSVIVVVALLAWFAAQDAARWWSGRGMHSSSSAGVHEIGVEGMSCGNCVDRLEKALRETEGVDEARVTLEPGQAVVRGSIDERRLREVVQNTGFEPHAPPS
jgi:uncharacterized membrane protein YraQ (UPF0718 family)/copper chaperone CopZ